MDFELSEDQRLIRETFSRFCDEEIRPKAAAIDEAKQFPREAFLALAELGFFGLSIPEKYGGVEMGNLAMILTTEELSRASLAAAGSLITRPYRPFR